MSRAVTNVVNSADDPAALIAECRALYRRTLLDDVVPFWQRHGIDREAGGLFNMLDDAGRVLGGEKYPWSQGRGLWTFASLYNRIEPRREWLETAKHIFTFLADHGRDEQGRWNFRLARDGRVLDGPTSIFVDGFCMAGLAEYFAATGDIAARRLALETFESTLRRIREPGTYGIAPYVLPQGMKCHGVCMVFSLFFFNLGCTLGDEAMKREGLALAHELLNDFYVPSKDAVLEHVSLDGTFIDSPQGRACVPGHVVEAMWFLISIFERVGDHEPIATCCRLIRRHLELGWDEPFGGLRLAIDIDGRERAFWSHAECKPWWVQVEALVATAYAHLHTGESWCLEWHRRVQRFAFSHYPVATGEWTPWVDRQGRRMANPVIPVKDPFHLPRALMELIDLFERRMEGYKE